MFAKFVVHSLTTLPFSMSLCIVACTHLLRPNSIMASISLVGNLRDQKSTIRCSLRPSTFFIHQLTVCALSTQTQQCHQSSSGGGPWGKAATEPNLLNAVGNVTFSSHDKLFSVELLSFATSWHWTVSVLLLELLSPTDNAFQDSH
jgi:hypothetical protein